MKRRAEDYNPLRREAFALASIGAAMEFVAGVQAAGNISALLAKYELPEAPTTKLVAIVAWEIAEEMMVEAGRELGSP